jgi:hypothetical protein
MASPTESRLKSFQKKSQLTQKQLDNKVQIVLEIERDGSGAGDGTVDWDSGCILLNPPKIPENCQHRMRRG